MNNFLIILAVAVVVLLVVIAGMSISIWIKKDGKFPETEISRNKAMKKLGLKCAKQEEIEMLNKERRKKKYNFDCGDCEECELHTLTEK